MVQSREINISSWDGSHNIDLPTTIPITLRTKMTALSIQQKVPPNTPNTKYQMSLYDRWVTEQVNKPIEVSYDWEPKEINGVKNLSITREHRHLNYRHEKPVCYKIIKELDNSVTKSVAYKINWKLSDIGGLTDEEMDKYYSAYLGVKYKPPKKKKTMWQKVKNIVHKKKTNRI